MDTNDTLVTNESQYDSHVFLTYGHAMSQSKTLTADRYRLLLGSIRRDFMRAHKQNDHGWKKHAADLLGVDRSMVSAVWAETKGVGARSAEKAKRRMALPVGFFMDPDFDAVSWLDGERPPAESHVEPLNEPPLLKRARETGQWPEWVLAAVPDFFHHRDGRYSYGDLVDFLDRMHETGRAELDRLKNRIGPPKRNGK